MAHNRFRQLYLYFKHIKYHISFLFNKNQVSDIILIQLLMFVCRTNFFILRLSKNTQPSFSVKLNLWHTFFQICLQLSFSDLPILEIWHSNIISKLKHSIQKKKNNGLPLINKRFSDLSILFLERSIVMGDLVSSQIPFVFHSFVTQSAGNGATRCMHVQYVLKEKL